MSLPYNKLPDNDLRRLFECPVCLELAIRPPLMQCKNGHILCDSCRLRVTNCPTCRSGPCNSRNLAMEKFALTLTFPCKFPGCREFFPIPEKINHESHCEFRPYNCPCPGTSCKWNGRLEEVIAHLGDFHDGITTLKGEDIVFLATDINLSGAADWVMMQSCFNFSFILVLEKHTNAIMEDQHFYALVQIVATPKQAEQFIYRLQLSHGSRRLSWEATPRSIQDGFQSTIEASDCLIFDSKTADFFADKGNLCINVTVSRIPGIMSNKSSSLGTVSNDEEHASHLSTNVSTCVDSPESGSKKRHSASCKI